MNPVTLFFVIYLLGTFVGCFRIGQIKHKYFDTEVLYLTTFLWPLVLSFLVISFPWRLVRYLGEKFN